MYLWSARRIHHAFIDGEVSATEIASYFLKRIKLLDPQICAFLHLLADRVMDRARSLDLRHQRGDSFGKLAAVPVAIKDNMHIQGEITTCGSKFLEQYRAPFSATVVSLLEREDALLIGKTNLDEFSMGSSTENSAYQKTRNPWNLAKVPGGSSGGSAAAVAGRLCPVALGSDTGGSIRQPAAFTGTVGLKPTYGKVSRYGLVAFGSSLDQIGPITHNVLDAFLITEVISRYCPHDANSLQESGPFSFMRVDPSPAKCIGIPWDFLTSLPEEMREQFQKSLDLLKERLQLSFVGIDLELLSHSLSAYYILSTAEASTNLARFDGIRYGVRSKEARSLEEVYQFSRSEGFGDEVKQRILIGTFVLSSGYHDAYYTRAQKLRTLLIRKYQKAFSQCELIVLPVTPTVAFDIGGIQNPLEMYLQDLYTVGANLAGLPAISLPSGVDRDRLPYGIQIVGPQLSDHKVLHFAYQCEQALDLSRLCPPLCDQEVFA